VQVNLALLATTPPTAATDAATGVTSTSATFNGTVNPRGFQTVAYFEWGETTSYGSTTPVQVLGEGVTGVAVSQAITGLLENVTYHYRVVAVSGEHIVNGADESITTLSTAADVDIEFPDIPPPVVATDAATSVTATTAQLNATVDPEGSHTSMYFEWGPTTSYGSTTPIQQLGNGTVSLTPSAVISGLSTGSTVHFRAVAYNAGGMTLGGDQSFTTP
jgi:hypothetical protein